MNYLDLWTCIRLDQAPAKIIHDSLAPQVGPGARTEALKDYEAKATYVQDQREDKPSRDEA